MNSATSASLRSGLLLPQREPSDPSKGDRRSWHYLPASCSDARRVQRRRSSEIPAQEGLRAQQSANLDIDIEHDQNHCSRGCRRSRRAFRAASIFASMSSTGSRSSLSRFALSHDCWSHFGAEGVAIVRMLIASSSATERPSWLSMVIFWHGECFLLCES
jgi:hypothetical protein